MPTLSLELPLGTKPRIFRPEREEYDLRIPATNRRQLQGQANFVDGPSRSRAGVCVFPVPVSFGNTGQEQVTGLAELTGATP